jgi:hypothetical protein
MGIRDTYAELLTEGIILDILRAGDPPSVSAITEEFNSFTETYDISEPLFDANNYHVEEGEAASVSKYNQGNLDIQRDLKVLYKHLFKISEQALSGFERWRAEAGILEGRLEDLEQRIAGLLLLSHETAGYFNFMQDNFVDASKIDLSQSTACINLAQRNVSIGTSAAGVTRVDLSSLEDKDVEFTVLSQSDLFSHVGAEGSRTKYAVSDARNFWQMRIYMAKPVPVSVELKVDMTEEKELSRIDVDLHMANQNSSAQLTPMYSTDDYNWKQLPISDPTRSVIDKATFQFEPVTARWVKFIITKRGFDQVHNELYTYEFGVDELAFYNESFAINTEVVLISQPLSVNDINGNPEEFSRLVLEVCEDIPKDTSIDYYVSVSNEEDMPASGFIAIDPVGRTSASAPTLLDFGDLDTVTISGVTISYASSAGSGIHVNPSQSFTLIEGTAADAALTTAMTASESRYSFNNSEERLLNHQVGSGVQIAQDSLEVWRNTSVQGNEDKVRNYVNGWGFDEPYYKTTVYVSNALGYEVDFGGKDVLVDGTPLSGRITIDAGRHILQVHKDNWKAVNSATVSGLASLKTADKLYPYNHRYLVEGFDYPSDWSDTDERVYRGFDLVAEYCMREVSAFDLFNNVPSDDYSKFARDQDVEDTGRTSGGLPADNTDPTTVFLIKVDESRPDFVNEQFVLRFKAANSLFSYLRFKAALKTKDTNITPYLDSYRIKISS